MEKSTLPRMNTLTIRWQRLVNEHGETCERCGATQEELEKAICNLQHSLSAVGVQIALEEVKLDRKTFSQDVTRSNRILVANRPLEEWLGAEVGESACSSCEELVGCDVACRTVQVGVKTYETIPAQLVIEAAHRAAVENYGVRPVPSDCCL